MKSILKLLTLTAALCLTGEIEISATGTVIPSIAFSVTPTSPVLAKGYAHFTAISDTNVA